MPRRQPCPEPVEGGKLTADGNWAYQYDIEKRLVRMRARENPTVCPTLATGDGGALDMLEPGPPMR